MKRKNIHYDEAILGPRNTNLKELREKAKSLGYPYFLVIPNFDKSILERDRNMGDKVAVIYWTRSYYSNSTFEPAAHVYLDLDFSGRIIIRWTTFGSLNASDTYEINSLFPYENKYKEIFKKVYVEPGQEETLSKIIYTRDMNLLLKDRSISMGKKSERTGMNYHFLRYFNKKEAIVDGKRIFAGIFTKALIKNKCIEVIPDNLNIGFEYDEETKLVKGYVFDYSEYHGCYKITGDFDGFSRVVNSTHEMVNFSYNIMYRKSDLEEINEKYFNNKNKILGGIKMRKIHYEESIFNRPQNSLEELNAQARLSNKPYFLMLSKFTKIHLLEKEYKDNLAAAYIFHTTNKHINSEDDLMLAAYIPFNLSYLGQIEIRWQLYGSLGSCDTYDVDFYYPYENGYKKLFSKIYSYPGDLDILSKMIYTRDMRLLANNEDIVIGKEVPDIGLRYYLLRVYPKSIIVDGKVLFAGIYSKAIDMTDSPFESIPDSLVIGFEYDEKENIVRIYDFYYDTREECFKLMTSYERTNKIAYTASEITNVLLNVMYSSKEYIEIEKKYFDNKKFRKEQREKENLGGKEMKIFNESRKSRVFHIFRKENDRRHYINNVRVVATILRCNPQVNLYLMEYTTNKGEVKVFDTSTETMYEYGSGYLSRFVNLRANAEDIVEVESKIKVPEDFDRSVLKSGFYAWDSSSNVTARVNDVIVIGAYKHVPKDNEKINLSFIKRNKRLELMNEGDLVIGLDKDNLNKIKFLNIKGEVIEEIPLKERDLIDVIEKAGLSVRGSILGRIYNNGLILKDNEGKYIKESNLKRYFDNLD